MAALAHVAVTTAGAVEINVYAAGAAKSVMTELAAQVETALGAKPHFTFGTVGALRERILAGEKVDVAILSTASVEALRKAARMIGETAPIGSVEVAIAVRKGANMPAIGTEEQLREALVAAPSVAFADPAHGATAGTHFARVLDRLGIAEEVRQKALILPFGIDVVEAVATGKAGLGVSQSSEIATHPGVALVGGLPGTLSLHTVYVAAAVTDSTAARGLVRFLATAPEAAEALRKAGFSPAVR